MITERCRLCDSLDLYVVIDLGFHPLADTFLPAAALNEPEMRYPLRVLLCNACGYALSQYVVSPEERYQKAEYSYSSSNSPVAKKHFEELAAKLATYTNFSSDSLAIDIGSNDGTLLSYIRDNHGADVLGIEPSANMAEIAEANGVATVRDFLNESSTARVAALQKPVRAITATNVFNHLEDVHGALAHMSSLLADDGVIGIEVPYLMDLLDQTAFDTIYLEHVSYFSLVPHLPVFEKYGLYPYHLETNPYMGGSVLVILGKDPSRANREHIDTFVAREEKGGARKLETYEAFMDRVRNLKYHLVSELYQLKQNGKKIAAVGAATKGNTLLNYCGIDGSLVSYVLESSPLKIGKYTPGSLLPIIDEKDLGSDISHLLILPWNIGQFLKEKLGHLPVEFIIPHT